MSRRRASLAFALALAAAVGCEPEPLTEIMVIIDTDMSVPSELVGFSVKVRDGDGALVRDQPFDLVNQVTLPADFGIVPRDGDASRRIEVEVGALLANNDPFSTRAITSFVEGRKVYLQMFLARRCIGVTCTNENETCRREGCVPIDDPDIGPKPPVFSGSSFGSSGSEIPYEAIAGKSGVHVAGIYGAAFTHGSDALATPGEQIGALLVSFGLDGSHRWTRSLPAVERSYANRIAIAESGEVEATGYFGGILTESSTSQTLDPGDSQAAYLVRYTPSGKLERLELVGVGGTNVQNFAFTIGADGRRLIGGLFGGNAKFGAGATTSLTTNGMDDGYVALLDADLSGVWAVNLGGAARDRITAIASSADAIYAGGIFETQAQIGSDALVGAGDNGFVAQLTPLGSVQWARGLTGSGEDVVRDVALLPDGSVVAVGMTGSPDFAVHGQAFAGTDEDAFIVALSPSGSLLWAKRLLGAGSSQAWSVSTMQYDGADAIAVSGEFSGTLTIDDQTLAGDANDMFVAVLLLSGKLRVTTQVGGAGAEGRAEVAAYGQRLWLAGEFQQDVGIGSKAFSAAGGSDILLTQILP